MNQSNRLYGIICLVTTFFLTSCLFHPDDDNNFKKVTPPAPVKIAKIDLMAAADTIDVFGPTEFSYKITGLEKNRTYYKEIDFYEGSNNGGQFTLNDSVGTQLFDPPNVQGWGKVTITVTTDPNTHSLADNFGLENIVFQRSWVLRIDTTVPGPLPITGFTREKGSLKVTWKKYEHENFLSYTLMRMLSGSYMEVKTIYDSDSAFYLDTDYVGGEATYWVISRNRDQVYASGDMTKYNDTIASQLTTYQNLPDGKMKINWSASRYPANVTQYEIYEGSIRGDETLLYTTKDATDTSLVFTPYFGESRFIRVRTYGHSLSGTYYTDNSVSSKMKEYVDGEKIPTQKYNAILFASSKNRYYTITDNLLSAFSEDKNKLIVSKTIPSDVENFQMSPDETQIVYAKGTQVFFLDVQTLQQLKSIDLSAFVSMPIIGVGFTPDNNLLLSVASDFDYTAALLVVDPSTGSVIKQYSNFRRGSTIVASPSGNRFITFDGNGSQGCFVGTATGTALTILPESGKSFFNPENEAEVIVAFASPQNGGNIIYSNLDDWSFIKRINTPRLYTMDTDLTNGYIAGSQENVGEIVIFDYINQATLLTLQPGVYPAVTLHNGYIYSNYGTRKYFLQ